MDRLLQVMNPLDQGKGFSYDASGKWTGTCSMERTLSGEANLLECDTAKGVFVPETLEGI